MNRDAIVEGAREAIERGSKSFRAASRLFAPLTRERAWMLSCWCRHCDDVADGQIYGFEGGTRGRVSDLRDRTCEALDGRPGQEIAFQALAQLHSERPLPTRFVDDHLDGFALDEQGWRPRSEADLFQYCYHVAGTVGCLMATIMGVSPDDGETLQSASDLGVAFQLSNIARDIREDLTNDRCYLPLDWFEEFGVAPDQLFQPAHQAVQGAMIGRLVDAVAAFERSARQGVGKLPYRSRVAVLTALRIYGAIGRRVRSLGPRAWDRRVTISRTRKLSYLIPSVAEAMVAAPSPR